VYSLHYHLVVVIKYRRNALYNEAIRERLKQIIWSLADELGIEILAQEPAEDHLHILFTATPTTNLSSIVNVIRGSLPEDSDKNFHKPKSSFGGTHFGQIPTSFPVQGRYHLMF
jgi:putative transposase